TAHAITGAKLCASASRQLDIKIILKNGVYEHGTIDASQCCSAPSVRRSLPLAVGFPEPGLRRVDTCNPHHGRRTFFPDRISLLPSSMSRSCRPLGDAASAHQKSCKKYQ